MSRLFCVLALFILPTFAFAASSPEAIDADPHLSRKAAKHNAVLAEDRALPLQTSQEEANVLRPFADYENVKYLVFSGYNGLTEARRAKSEIIKNLPPGVQVVIYDSLGSPNAGKQDLSFYSQFIELIRLTRFLFDTSSIGFWSRDTIPVPVIRHDGSIAGVDAKYYRNFEPDAEFSKNMKVPLIKHDYYHEGGNFLADRSGRCFLVNNERAVKIPDSLFQNLYGCSSVHRFEKLKGIGHIDERVKLVSDTEAMTDTPQYVEQLQALGFRVTLLPSGDNYYETYANSILINGEVFLPVFNQSNDQKAIAAYESLGLNVHPIVVDELPNSGHGSLHCITMTYPEIRAAQGQ